MITTSGTRLEVLGPLEITTEGNQNAVGEHALGMLLALFNKLANYSFEVRVNNGTHRSFGTIEILDFNIEQQFINANVQKLEQLATNTDGAIYFDSEANQLITNLISDNRFSSIQKIIKKTVPLIDIKIGLLVLILSLAIEWFIRKYNGLI